MKETLENVILTNPNFLWVWGILVAVSLAVTIYDLTTKNAFMGGLMKWVWALTVLYSGPIGLAIYFFSGRAQIARDSIWRRSFRSVAHCYSGCGAGEVAGILIAVGLLALSTVWVAILTFSLAYAAGFALTVGPLMQEGVGFKQALWDAFYSETASITVMEITAIGLDLWLAGNATMAEPLFWSSLVFSLTAGLAVAYPVNVWLIKVGVKEGMHDPREMASHGHH